MELLGGATDTNPNVNGSMGVMETISVLTSTFTKKKKCLPATADQRIHLKLTSSLSNKGRLREKKLSTNAFLNI